MTRLKPPPRTDDPPAGESPTRNRIRNLTTTAGFRIAGPSRAYRLLSKSVRDASGRGAALLPARPVRRDRFSPVLARRPDPAKRRRKVRNPMATAPVSTPPAPSLRSSRPADPAGLAPRSPSIEQCPITFAKAEACGNDFVIVDEASAPQFVAALDGAEPLEAARLVRRLLDRRMGVGADGLLVIDTVERAESRFRLRIVNADGTPGGRCGNGIRAAAAHVLRSDRLDHDVVAERGVVVETGPGPVHVTLPEVEPDVKTAFAVDLGEPVLELDRIPVDITALGDAGGRLGRPGAIHRIHLDTIGRRRSDPPRVLAGLFVNVGNPHVVIAHPDLDGLDVAAVGPLLEHHPAFPERMNVHFVHVLDRTTLRMRSWERGAGETSACGTGAAAALVANAVAGRTERRAAVHCPGGRLDVTWSIGTHRLVVAGPARIVFRGTFDLDGI